MHENDPCGCCPGEHKLPLPFTQRGERKVEAVVDLTGPDGKPFTLTISNMEVEAGPDESGPPPGRRDGQGC